MFRFDVRRKETKRFVSDGNDGRQFYQQSARCGQNDIKWQRTQRLQLEGSDSLVSSLKYNDRIFPCLKCKDYTFSDLTCKDYTSTDLKCKDYTVTNATCVE